MKKIIRSIDLLLFLIIFIFIFNYLLSNKILSLNSNKNSYNLLNNLPLMTNLYKYNSYEDKLISVVKQIPNVYIFNTHYEEKYNDTNVKFILSDMFENINQKFDIIISNPPYIEKRRLIL